MLLARQDALALTPAGDIDAFARAAVEFADDAEHRRAVGEAGRRLYDSEFDWPHVVSRVMAAMGPILPGRTSAPGLVAATA
jgi:glycosyltransferase involved in cell wall biosynthesis